MFREQWELIDVRHAGLVSNVSGMSSRSYNCSLALCHLLTVCYQYSDEQLRNHESYLLLPAYPLFITGLTFRIYNYYDLYTCFMYTSPLCCDKAESPIEYERGEKYTLGKFLDRFCGLHTRFECCILIYYAMKCL